MSLKLGDRNETVRRWRQVINAMYGGLYTRLHGPLPTDTDEFGQRAVEWQKEYESRTGQEQDGIVSDQDLLELHVVRPHRPIWCYSAPGSGAPWWMGPPFDLGEWCKQVLNLNHQPIGYPIGGYMGLMGGDPSFSYIDVVNALSAELERLISINPDMNDHNVEFWFFGYSQSADALKQAVDKLFGVGGRFEVLRPRINGLVLFGDPARRPGPTKVGNNPVGRGIAQNRTFPQWLEDLVWDIVNETPTPDFYAAVTDKIRPLFYEWFVKAETELPFVVYSAQIIIPALLNAVAPFLGALPGLAGLASPLAAPILAQASGVPVSMMSGLLGAVTASTEKPNPELIKLLSLQGILTSIPDLIALLGALPGIGVHGDYYAEKPEFGGRSGIQVGCDIVAGFRR